jgi:hypothetical protein
MRILIILIFITLGCSNSNKENRNNLTTDSIYLNNDNQIIIDNDFQKFISSAPKINLPFTTYCAYCCDYPIIDNDNILLKKYLPEGASLVGLVSTNKKYSVILVTYPADMIIPSIVVYDYDGKVIDEKNFMTNYCGQEYDFLGLQYFYINKDLTFSEIDTSFTFQMDSITNMIIDTIETEVSQKSYFINSNGKIDEK